MQSSTQIVATDGHKFLAVWHTILDWSEKCNFTYPPAFDVLIGDDPMRISLRPLASENYSP